MFNPYSGPVQVQSDPAVGPGDLVQTATGAMTNLRLGPGVRPESGDPSPVPEVTGGEVRNMIQGWEKQDVKRAGWLVIFQCSSFQLEHVLFFLAEDGHSHSLLFNHHSLRAEVPEAQARSWPWRTAGGLGGKALSCDSVGLGGLLRRYASIVVFSGC